jgi:hypothetical protein
MTCEDQYGSFEKRQGRQPGEIFTAFKVTANVDKNEGRFGGIETVGVFFTRKAAVKAAKGVDVMGSDGKVEGVRAIMSIDGNAYECGHLITMVSEAELRERAMEKVKDVLTEEEQRALGLRR